ncbi:hypothetical protein GCM10008960_29480 [Deinococcus sedimenti]|uniref:Uncharacterized protein n=2 Tax=Deinococcus sedimenti TaxID=1867090 RepID=A0ABQ2S9G3_9DEIO|nr:hypothetical protein GCM10008960_29480 [Deinococcus sedimenti]
MLSFDMPITGRRAAPMTRLERRSARREAERDYLSELRGDKSRANWYHALGLPMWTLGGFIPRGGMEAWEEASAQAEATHRAHWAVQSDTTRWYAAQVAAGRRVTTAELAERLGAVDEAHGARLLEAWAFDLFHLHRHLWRALKRQEAHEAGLTGGEIQAQVRREEARLQALTARPALPVPPSRVKRPRPVEYRPQVQPNAPTN